MNTAPDSEARDGDPGGGTPRQAGPPAGSTFFSWMRDLGIVRGSDRWFAGVAGGIAQKAGIDPLIVRGVFVVLALLGGPGVLLYLVGWLLLPDGSGRIHTEDIVRGRASGGVVATAIVLVCVFVIPAFVGMFVGGAPAFIAPGLWGWDLWDAIGIPAWLTSTVAWLFWIAVLVFGFLWLRSAVLKRGREQSTSPRPAASEAGSAPFSAPASAPTMSTGSAWVTDPAGTTSASSGDGAGASGTSADEAGQAGQAGTTGTTGTAGTAGSPHDSDPTRPLADFAERTEEFAQRTSERAAAWGQRVGEQASRWGEDVGRQADEWSARYAEHHDAHRIGAAQVIITSALALLAAGLAWLWTLHIGVEDERLESGVAVPVIAALIAGLAVLAVSLIIAGARGRHTGFVGFLSFCGVVVLLFAALLPWGVRFQPFGPVHLDSTGAPGAVVVAGTSRVDLRDLDDAVGDASQPIEIWQIAGNSTVLLPETHPARVEVRVLAGRIEEAGGVRGESAPLSGPFLSRTVTTESTADERGAAAGDEVMTVTVYLLAGNVTIDHTENLERSSSATARETPAEAEAEADAEAAEVQLQQLETLLERAEWRLEEPGLNRAERRALDTEIDEIREDMADLEQEMNR